MGFAPSKLDSSLFVRQDRLRPVILLLYVDDLVIADADLEENRRIKFHLGNLHYFLRIDVIHTLEGIFISQHHALNMPFKFRMVDCKPISTPMDKNVKLRRDSKKSCDPTRFRQIVGSLIYLTITRSDLSYLVGRISQFMSQTTTEHFPCAQRIL